MSEQMRHGGESLKNHGEIERAAAERLKQLERSSERERPRHEKIESAREQLKQAEQVRPKAEAASTSEASAPKVLTKTASYRHTMISLQHRMKPASRAFSKFIHAPVIDSTSEALGKTVFRPSVTLGATTSGVVLAGFVYLYARSQGFLLRGSEILAAMLIGAVLGIIVEASYKAGRRIFTR